MNNSSKVRMLAIASVMTSGFGICAAPAAHAAASSNPSVNQARVSTTCRPAHHGKYWRWHDEPSGGHDHWDYRRRYWADGQWKWRWEHHYRDDHYCR